jgi:hypothetical protein
MQHMAVRGLRVAIATTIPTAINLQRDLCGDRASARSPVLNEPARQPKCSRATRQR